MSDNFTIKEESQPEKIAPEDESAPGGIPEDTSEPETPQWGFFRKKKKLKIDVYTATQWQLMWLRFKKHKLAHIALYVVILIYVASAFVEMIAPNSPRQTNRTYLFAPPQLPRFVDSEGQFSLRPFVYGAQQARDPETFRPITSVDTSVKKPLRLFVQGAPYKFWGLIDGSVRLVGTEEGEWFPLGTDRLGRCIFTRIVYGTRISTSIGLIGVTLSFLMGIFFGGIAGYFGGVADTIIMRIVEFLRSIPSLPLWMALAAALPANLPPLTIYFMITIILSIIGWTGLARVVRGRFLSLRSEDFVLAAELSGSSRFRIIFRHMVPSFSSHIIASISLSIPGMILAETSLSFLGLGLRPPTVSWGVLLQEAQNLQTVAYAPWLLTPVLFIVVTVLAFNFVGDGLRDASDPYSR